MKRLSPTLEGFRVMFRLPSLGLAEIAWRWSFGAATSLLAAFCLFEYLDTLPVGGGDLFLLSTRQPALIAHAIAHIFRGSALRFLNATFLLSLGLAGVWICASSFGRAATLKALIAHFDDSDVTIHEKRRLAGLRPLFGLGALRAIAALVAVTAGMGSFILAGTISSPDGLSSGLAFLVFLTLLMFVMLAWSVVNWFLSFAAVFSFRQGQDTFGTISSVAELCRNRLGPVLAVSCWFGLAHGIALFLASSVVAFPLAFATVLPASIVLGGVLLCALLYFLVADFLYVGRLAAYLLVAEGPDLRPVQESSAILPPPLPSEPADRVGPDERILSDVPLETC